MQVSSIITRTSAKMHIIHNLPTWKGLLLELPSVWLQQPAASQIFEHYDMYMYFQHYDAFTLFRASTCVLAAYTWLRSLEPTKSLLHLQQKGVLSKPEKLMSDCNYSELTNI
jgi:hypothetical protein